MANNRIYLVCKKCVSEREPAVFEETHGFVAKSMGAAYYTTTKTAELDTFFARHEACGLNAFTIDYDVPDEVGG